MTHEPECILVRAPDFLDDVCNYCFVASTAYRRGRDDAAIAVAASHDGTGCCDCDNDIAKYIAAAFGPDLAEVRQETRRDGERIIEDNRLMGIVIQRLREVHYAMADDPRCVTCSSETYPCPTIRALDGEQA